MPGDRFAGAAVGRVTFLDKSRYWAGAEQSLAELVSGLINTGMLNKVAVDFPLPHHERYKALGSKVQRRYSTMPRWAPEAWRRPPRGLDRLSLMLLARRLHTLIREHRYEIVHINLLRSRSIYDVRAARRARAAVVGHVRMLEDQAFPNRRVLEACDGVIGISRAVTDAITRRAPNARAVTIHDLVDTEHYRTPPDVAAARARFGLPLNGVIVVSPHSMIHRKGHDIAIRALAAAGEEGADTLLVIAGGEPGRFDARTAVSREELTALARALGVADRVVFTGEVDDMRSFYAASDVVLALSRDGEAFGRIVAEGGLMERPVVATNLGATPELIVDGETGLLVPPEDVDATASALRCLLQDAGERVRLGRAARDWLEPRISREAVVGQVLRFYEEILAARRGDVAR